MMSDSKDLLFADSDGNKSNKDIGLFGSHLDTNNSPIISDQRDKLPNESLSFEKSEEETDTKPKKKRAKQKTSNALLYSIIVATVWILGAIVFIAQPSSGLTGSLNMFTVVIALIAPAAVAVFAGMMLEATMRSNKSSRALAMAAKKLMEPDKVFENGAKSTISNVRSEIGRLEDTISNVTEKLGSLEENIQKRASTLKQASEDAKGGAAALAQTMEVERSKLGTILDSLTELTKSAQQTTQNATKGLDDQAQLLMNAANNIAEKSDGITASTTSLTDRLDIAASKAIDAAKMLDYSTANASQTIDDFTIAANNISNVAENASANLLNASEKISDEAIKTKEITDATIADIKSFTEQSANNIIEALKTEAQVAKSTAEESIRALEEATASMRRFTQEADNTVNNQIDRSAKQLETLRQHSFDMSIEADNFTDKRISGAKSLIFKSTDLLNDAGEQIEKKFTDIANNCATQAQAVKEILDGLDKKLERLPKEAQDRARFFEGALSDTLAKLTETSKKATEQNKTLDNDVQNKIAKSYDVLDNVADKISDISHNKNVSDTNFSPSVSSSLDRYAQNLNQFKNNNELNNNSYNKEPKLAKSGFVSGFNSPMPEKPLYSPAPTLKDADKDLEIELRGKAKTENNNEGDFNPFSDLGNSNTPNSPDWSWKDVLSSIDSGQKHEGFSNFDKAVNELDIAKIQDFHAIEKIRQLYTKNRNKALAQVATVYGRTLDIARQKISENNELRSYLIKFLNEKRETILRGRSSDLELRLYLIAEAALDNK